MFQAHRAIVTGASSGLGAEFARQLAARGTHLVLVARRRDRLESLASELRAAHGIEVMVVDLDLSAPAAGTRLAERLDGVAIDLLVNNAGFATHGRFETEDPDAIAREIAVDVAAVVDLTRAFVPAMIAAGRGAVLSVASTASAQPVPGMAVYGASKAFVKSFSSALWHELRGTGVHTVALMPGATRTEFFDVVGNPEAAVGSMQTAEQVVALGLRELDRARPRPSVVSGRGNAIGAWFARVMPQRLVLDIAARAVNAPHVTQPRSAARTGAAVR